MRDFNFLKLGKVKELVNTTMRVIAPPKITEGITPRSFAANPDSKAPISFDEPMKMLFTAATRPFISSGVNSWRIVWRITTLTESNIPLNARAKTEK